MVELADSNKTGPYLSAESNRKEGRVMKGYNKTRRRKSSGRSKVGHELIIFETN